MNNNKSTISPIKAFNDNYIWAIHSIEHNSIALVDPGDAAVCIAYIEKNQLILTAILVTHHHQDHVGGIKLLLDYANEKGWLVTIYGPSADNVKHLTIKLSEGDQVNLAEIGINLNVVDLPGHTKGHIGYVNNKVLFCGDTLFSGGCGRLFEGTPKQMHNSLTKLINLPDSTLVYCAHEYTQANLNFALTVEPKNNMLIKYQQQVSQLRRNNKATIPSSIGLEKQINPFLRCDKHSISLAAQDYEKKELTSTEAIFATLRSWKDKF